MPCPQRHPTNAIRRPEPAASCRTWLRPVAGLALAVCGLILVVAGMPSLTSPAIAELEVRTGVPGIERSVERTDMAAPVRLGWMSTRLEVSRRAAGSDLATRDRQTSERVAGAAPRQPRERFLEQGTGREAAFSFPDWDLREHLAEMANDQHGFWRRQCLCPKVPIGQGPR